MSYMNIDHNKCVGCGECVADCPFGALRLTSVSPGGANKAVIGPGCHLCSTCEMVCEHDAIELVSGSAPDADNQASAIRDAEDFHF